MYIPPDYKENDEHKLIEFMQSYDFATLISISDNVPIATHLPFIIEKRNEKLFLISHMAKANSQWQTISENEVLIIFQGPHAFVSPQLYERRQNVPTWNYMAVHAYGKATIIDKSEEVIKMMEKTIFSFEKEFYDQWKSLPNQYVDGMLKALVIFEIKITKLEGQFKLSQDKSIHDQQTIISSFEKSNDTVIKKIAIEMKKNLL